MSKKNRDRRPNLAHLINPKPPAPRPERAPRPGRQANPQPLFDLSSFEIYAMDYVMQTGRQVEFLADLVYGRWPHSTDEALRDNLAVVNAGTGAIVLDYQLNSSRVIVAADLDQHFVWMGLYSDYERYQRLWTDPTTGAQLLRLDPACFELTGESTGLDGRP